MCSALLATEGASDEIVCKQIMGYLYSAVSVTCKTFPSRGFDTIRRSAPTLARAAYYGFSDILVIQFDLDDSFVVTDGTTSDDIRNCSRWQDISSRIQAQLNSLYAPARKTGVRVVLMSPAQSTDAWLRWGLVGGSGWKVETKNRNEIKSLLYGDPPRGSAEKAVAYSSALLKRMQNSEDWPVTLRHFVFQLDAAVASLRAI
jgi:hypothetical protein